MVRINEVKVFKAMKQINRGNRADIIKITELPRTTVYDQLKKLMKKKIVIMRKENRKKIGSPQSIFSLIPSNKENSAEYDKLGLNTFAL